MQSPVKVYFLFRGDELSIQYFLGRGSGIVRWNWDHPSVWKHCL